MPPTARWLSAVVGAVGHYQARHRKMRPALSCLFVIAATISASAQVARTVTLRGHRQTLDTYPPPEGVPIIVSSGDGGWIHLGRAYLASFTSGRLWVVKASDHRFSDDFHEFDQRLLEAIEWIQANAPR